MIKITKELGSVNPYVRLDFEMIINTEEDDKLMGRRSLGPSLTQRVYNGNRYIRIRTSPFITLHVGKKNYGERSLDNSYVINEETRHYLLLKLRLFLHKFKTPDLFLRTNQMSNKLKVNPNLIEESSFSIVNAHGKILRMEPAVIEENPDIPGNVYEGAILYVNGYDTYVYLRFDDVSYLYRKLDEIRFQEFAWYAFNTYLALENKTDFKIETYKPKPIIKKEEEELSTGALTAVKAPQTIPDI